MRSGSGPRRERRIVFLEGVPGAASSQAAALDGALERHSQKSS